MALESTTWRDYVEKLSTPWMARTVGARWFGLLGLIADTASEGIRLALLANWLLEPTSPDDVLPKIGRERRLPRYPAETPAQHRARLHQAWVTWQRAGSHQNLITQFANAGYPNAMVFDNVDIYEWENPHDTDNVSRFWMVIPPESHSWVDDGIWSDPGTYDDGGLWDVGNATFEQIQQLRGIIRKFKPLDWKCWGIIAVQAWDNPTITNADDFSHSDWTKGTSTTVTPDDIAGPEVGTFGDRIEHTGGAPATTIRVAQVPGNIEAGRPTHYVFYCKAGTASRVAIVDQSGLLVLAWFNLDSGLVESRFGYAEIVSLGDGWYRCDAANDASVTACALHVVDDNFSLTCSPGAYVYVWKAEVLNHKIADSIVFGAT